LYQCGKIAVFEKLTGSGEDEGYSIIVFDLIVIGVILAAVGVVIFVFKRKRKR